MWETDRIRFYHIPRTGGRWVVSAMIRSGVKKVHRSRPEGRQKPLGLRREHAPPLDLAPERREGFFEFAFVRKPADWYRSFWAYRCRARDEASGTDAPDRWRDPHFALDAFWDDDLDAFVRKCLDGHPGFVTEMYRLYTPDLSFVGRQERLTEDLASALSQSGTEYDGDILSNVPPINVAPSRPIDPALVDRINESERWVLETFYGGVKWTQ